MAVAKIYNSQTGQWEAVIVGTTGDTGVVQSDTEPSNTDQLWLDTDDTAEPLAIPAGGSAGQILQKSTDGDYDTAWSNVPSHNYVINGAFDIWQRGTSFSADNFYTADRFLYRSSGATATISRQSFTPNELPVSGFGDANFYLRLGITGADAGARLQHAVEDVRTLAGQTVTISFWAKSDNDNTVFMRTVQDFGSGGSTAVLTSERRFTTTSTWQRFTQVETLGSMSGKTIGANSNIQVWIGEALAETGNIDFWGVQLEAGSVATPFKRNAPSLQGELAACQRYYIRYGEGAGGPLGQATVYSSTNAYMTIFFPVTMRANPTPTPSRAGAINIFSNGSAFNTSAIAADSISPKVYVANLTSSGMTAGNAGFTGFQLVTDFYEFSAEL